MNNATVNARNRTHQAWIAPKNGVCVASPTSNSLIGNHFTRENAVQCTRITSWVDPIFFGIPHWIPFSDKLHLLHLPKISSVIYIFLLEKQPFFKQYPEAETQDVAFEVQKPVLEKWGFEAAMNWLMKLDECESWMDRLRGMIVRWLDDNVDMTRWR